MSSHRAVIFPALVILALAGAFAAYRYLTPVTSRLVIDEPTNDELCAIPGPVYRLNVPREGCLIRATAIVENPSQMFNPEECLDGLCDGSRNGTFNGVRFEEAGSCVLYGTSDHPLDCGWRLKRNGYTYNEEIWNIAPVGLGGACEDVNCCSGGSYQASALLPCADPSTTCVPTPTGYRCCNDPDPAVCVTPDAPRSASSRSAASSRSSAPAARCGDGITQSIGADGFFGTDDDEQCDDGDDNVPSGTGAVADKDWWDITPDDVAVLSRSSCLSTCKKAQCSDGEDNDGKNDIDNRDLACYDGIWGDGPTYLKGYNKEDCPLCKSHDPADTLRPEDGSVQNLAQVTNTVPTSPFIPQAESTYPGLDQLYCLAGYPTVRGNACSCTETKQICFPQWIDSDGDDSNDTFRDCSESECRPLTTDLVWANSCVQGTLGYFSDAGRSNHYRCALHSTYTTLSPAYDVNIFRYRKLIDNGGQGCRSHWDCESNYIINGTSIRAKSDIFATTRCVDGENGRPDGGRCCPRFVAATPHNPGTGTGGLEGCGRLAPAWQNQGQRPNFEIPNCGPLNGPLLGPPGGINPVVGGGDSGNGGNDSGNNGSNSSDSSGPSCFNTNPCLAVTSFGTPRLSYSIPPQCPLTGNQRTCYNSCVATLNSQARAGNSNAQTNFSQCVNSTCRVREDDLNMCPCNPDFFQCFLDCGRQESDCSELCSFDPDPRSCRTQCRDEGISCSVSCGQACPVSASSLSRRSTGSNASDKTSSNGGGGAKDPQSSVSSRSSSQNSNANSSAKSIASTPPNTSAVSNASSASMRSASSMSSTVCDRGDVCITAQSCHDRGGAQALPGLCGSADGAGLVKLFCCDVPPISQSSSSSTSLPPVGVCCEAGNCNPFGTCSNPFSNYNACTLACAPSSTASAISNASSQASWDTSRSAGSVGSNASRTSASRTSSIASAFSIGSFTSSASISRGSSQSNVTGSSQSAANSQSSSTVRSSGSDDSSTSNMSSSSRSSSRSSSSSSSRSSSSMDFFGSVSSRLSSRISNGSTGGITGGTTSGTTGTDVSTTGGTTGGITSDNGSSRPFYGADSSNVFAGIADSFCRSDSDCPLTSRCILNRCLTPQQIAALPDFCGNLRTDAGEQCDNGSQNSDAPNAYCRTDCRLGRCGDGIIDTPLEQCDDGNNADGDGCSSACVPERGAPVTLPAQVVELPFAQTSSQWVVGSGQNEYNQSNLPNAPTTPDTGPAALAVMIAGGAAGLLYRKRK